MYFTVCSVQMRKVLTLAFLQRERGVSLQKAVIQLNFADKCDVWLGTYSFHFVFSADNPATSLNSDQREPVHLPSMNNRRVHTSIVAAQTSHPIIQRISSDLPDTAPAKLEKHSPIPKFKPSSARPPTPLDIFHYHSAPSHRQLAPGKSFLYSNRFYVHSK